MSQLAGKLIGEQKPSRKLEPHRHPKRGDEEKRITGVLLRINHDKGYGFIRPDAGGAEYFVHVGAMIDRHAWNEGQAVSFIPGEQQDRESRKAPPAYSVRAVRPPQEA